MGPRSVERGKGGVAIDGGGGGGASMGPRSVERGKVPHQSCADWVASLQWGRVLLNAERNAMLPRSKPRKTLQWGRVLLNAESFVGLVDEHLEPSLQWGRVLLNAERRECLTPVHRTELASMGPRSVERGKMRIVNRVPQSRAGFNGAAFC